MKLNFKSSRKLNFTGKIITPEVDSYFINNQHLPKNILLESNLAKQVELSIAFLNCYSDEYDYVIIENNPLGVALFEKMFPKTKFLISWKKQNTHEHSHWHILERIKLNTY